MPRLSNGRHRKQATIGMAALLGVAGITATAIALSSPASNAAEAPKENCAGLDTALQNNLNFIAGQQAKPDAQSEARIANRQAVVNLIQQRRQTAGCTANVVANNGQSAQQNCASTDNSASADPSATADGSGSAGASASSGQDQGNGMGAMNGMDMNGMNGMNMNGMAQKDNSANGNAQGDAGQNKDKKDQAKDKDKDKAKKDKKNADQNKDAQQQDQQNQGQQNQDQQNQGQQQDQQNQDQQNQDCANQDQNGGASATQDQNSASQDQNSASQDQNGNAQDQNSAAQDQSGAAQQSGDVVCQGSTVTTSGDGGQPAASSNQFPAGTMLKVTNLDNSKSITVPVTSTSGSCALLNTAAFNQVHEAGKFLIRHAKIEKVG